MSAKSAALIACASLLLAPTAVLAHHSLQEQFDTSRTITLTGAVEKIDWRNPHMRLFLDVPGAGSKVTWEVEMGPPHLQMINGWKIDTYRRGDRVSVDAYPARDGSNFAYGTKVKALRR